MADTVKWQAWSSDMLFQDFVQLKSYTPGRQDSGCWQWEQEGLDYEKRHAQEPFMLYSKKPLQRQQHDC
eukprot:1156532-Pelagomonas_calceolata.AAC.10